MAQKQVRIVWNGQGGELDSATAVDDNDNAIANAIIKMLADGIVAPGDSITVELVE